MAALPALLRTLRRGPYLREINAALDPPFSGGTGGVSYHLKALKAQGYLRSNARYASLEIVKPLGGPT